MTGARSSERRAGRLVHCYPRAWRERYGEEYTQLLIDELGDGTWSLGRAFDVLAHGIWTRVAYTGLVGEVAAPAQRRRAMLAALAGVGAVFVMLAVGVWSQLAVGWQWSAPTDPGTRAAITLMSAAVIGLAAAMILLAVPALLQVLIRVAASRAVVSWRPLLSACAAGVIIAVGCHHFGPHWPGSGGHAWAGRGLLPSWFARFGWAGTLWISAYWAHPAALGSFPASEVVWMLISPFAWAVLAGSGIALIRGAGMTRSLARWVLAMFTITVAMMVTFLVGAVLWLLSGRSGPRNMFAVGGIDLVIVSVLAAGLVTATQLMRRVGIATLLSVGG